MDHVIALDWGRLSQEIEAPPAENRKRKSSADSKSAQALDEKSRIGVLQRLADAIAVPPEPGLSLYDEAVTYPAAEAIHLAAQQPSAEESSFRQSLAEDTSGNEQHPASLATLHDTHTSAPSIQKPAADVVGKYHTRLMWTGLGFEEREVLITPSFEETASPQPPAAPVLEESSNEMSLENMTIPTSPSWEPAQAVAIAPEPQAHAAVEESFLPPPPQPAPELAIDAPQAAPRQDPPASALASSNGSNLLRDAKGSEQQRWFVLNGVLNGAPAPQQPPADAAAGTVPLLQVFSLAGGAGKTTLVATLGRALSARGQRVLLVEATTFGSLPCFFGASDCRPGVVRTFRPPSSSSDAPIRLATVDPEAMLHDSAPQRSLASDIQQWAQGAGRVIVDVATGNATAARNLSRISSIVLVPLIPDVNSVIAANTIDSFFQRQANAAAGGPDVYYILNQFDPSMTLHLEVAKVLRKNLGDRLLPFALERNPSVSEALADGMTMMDYAPGSPLAEDYITLAQWVEHVMAPAQTHSPNARWSEQ
ncbi:MAG TPA: cellulose synthase operon protein YhjQ/BcsQ [Terracidiphilus sp.]|nr:cellulose synthase operon protein YhjQ/BcsQ [Terracidiphilus sp.]